MSYNNVVIKVKSQKSQLDMPKASGGKVEVRLQGGLGNQLFGWAAGFAVSQRLRSELILNDINLYQHGYQLDAFDLGTVTRVTKSPKQNFKLMRCYQKFPGVFKEQNFCYDPRIESVKNPVILEGYFQSWKYSQDFMPAIKGRILSLKRPSAEFKKYEKLISEGNYVAVHVRRGDYNQLLNYHGIIGEFYYKKARDLFLDLDTSIKFIVFSDEIETARKVVKNADLYLSSKEVVSPAENLVLMAICKGLIGANSSLSLWAGLAMDDVDAVRIFPRPWFTTKDLDTRDLLPPSFITLGD